MEAKSFFCIIASMSLSNEIKQKSLDLGFDVVGITNASSIWPEHIEYIRNWLKGGFAGQMGYMERNFEKRINPAELLEGAKSVIVCALNIKNREEIIADKGRTGRVAAYARYEDYHIFIKNLLQKAADFIAMKADESVHFKLCVDSVPIAEKSLAQRAGVGFIGKNHILINPRLGPAILLGEIIATIDLEPDEPLRMDCKGCNKCIEACPTGALRADGRFDANKCISYLTMVYKGDIDENLAAKMGDRLFGCDECVMVCPYYKNAPYCKNKEIKYEPQRGRLDLQAIINMGQEDFQNQFRGTAIERIGINNLKRSAQICLKNMQQKTD